MTALVETRGLRKSFRRNQGVWSEGKPLHAVRGVDLDIAAGESVGLVGESGSGKSTVGRMLIRLIEPDSGTLRFDGEDLLSLKGRELRRRRRDFQMIFQDPYGSLNPRMKIGYAIGEPLIIHKMVANKSERLDRVAELLVQVGLDPAMMDRYPHEFSGGQRQRIGIARAIACSPRFVVADEPVSALDPPVQAQIVNLLAELQEKLGLAYLFIAHDLALVRHFCQRVYVMHRGSVVEKGPSARLFDQAAHPYTQTLLASIPRLVPGAPAEVPVFSEESAGDQAAELKEISPGHWVAVDETFSGTGT